MINSDGGSVTAGARAMVFADTKIRVRYADTDQMKIVYYGKYFEYFEQGRSDLLRQIGLPYPEIERQGFLLPVIEAHADYRRSALYDEELTVRTMIHDVPQARIRISYIVTRVNGEVLTEGHTVHSFLDAARKVPARVPEFVRIALEKALRDAGS